LIEASIITNAALGAYWVQQELTAQSALKAVYGVYLLETRKVWTPKLGYPEGDGLAAAPHDQVAFQELGDATVQSSRLMTLLGDRIEPTKSTR
jgi:carbonic anhydrase